MKKALDYLEKGLRFICSVLMVGIMIMIAAQVFTRYVLNNALTWSEHAARGMFIWMLMLYAGVLIRNAGNLGFDLIAKSLPQKVSLAFNLICELLIFAFAVFWFFQGIAICQKFAKFNFADLKLPYNTIYAAEPVGAALIALFSGEAFIKRLREAFGKEEKAC